MISNIQSTKENKVEDTWVVATNKAVHDGAKLIMIKDKLNEIIDLLNKQFPKG